MIFYSKQLNEKSTIGSELLFVQIEGKELLKTQVINEIGDHTGEFITSEGYQHISYISLPIYYGIALNKTTVNLGFQGMLTIASSGREKGQAPLNGDIFTWDIKYEKLNIDKYDFGPRVGIIYELAEKISLEGNFYYGINNILCKTAHPDFIWKSQQVIIGIRYRILNLVE